MTQLLKKIYHFILTNYFTRKEKTFLVFTTPEDLKKGLSYLYLYSAKELDIPGFSDNKNICKIDTDLEALKKRIINIEKNNSLEITEESKLCL